MENVDNSNSESHTKHLVFRVGGQLYGAPLDDIIEVIEPVATTAYPNGEPELVGVVNLRGEIISVIDFRVILKQPTPRTPKMFMIITPSQSGKVSVLVDEMIEVFDFLETDVDRDPHLNSKAPKLGLLGIAKYGQQIVYLVSLPKMIERFTSKEVA
jgi:purine-binding chemotaxis protein CheW